jgi:hypothetical protein
LYVHFGDFMLKLGLFHAKLKQRLRYKHYSGPKFLETHAWNFFRTQISQLNVDDVELDVGRHPAGLRPAVLGQAAAVRVGSQHHHEGDSGADRHFVRRPGVGGRQIGSNHTSKRRNLAQ